jgi:DNA-binding protein HU-beta
MNKAELINAIASESGLSKIDSKKALDAFITSVTKALKDGEKVTLVGFGTFRTGQRAEKAGYDPANKTPITIPSKRVARFKAGTDLLAAVE